MASDLAGRLRDARSDLSVWYDRLNSLLKDTEELVRSVGISQPVWVYFGQETIEAPEGYWDREFVHSLGYAKVRDQWRLCYAYHEADDPDSVDPKPVLECSVEVRQRAVEGLPLLLSKIVEEAEAEASKIETTLGAALESLTQFKNGFNTSVKEPIFGENMTVRDVLKILESDGWRLVVTRGSHRQFKHPTKPGRVTVAGKPSDDLPPGTLNSILKQSGLKR